METRTFKMAYWRWLLPLMILVGLSPSATRIAIEHDALAVKMGWFWFQVTIPLRSIVHARRSSNAWLAVGVHTDLKHGWIVNGSPLGMVHLTIQPRAVGRCAGVPIQVSNLRLSLDDPDAFIDALTAANPGAA